VNNPIFVLLRILNDEANTSVPILKHLSIHLIKFIRFHLVNRNVDMRRFKGNLSNLLEQIAPYYKAVLESLATKLQEEIEHLDSAAEKGGEARFESIDLIQFAISDLRALYPRLLETRESQVYLTQILQNLLNGMKIMSNDNKNFELIIPSLDVID
jgi:hypothetical protein